MSDERQVVEVDAEVVEDRGLTVSFTPAAIVANFDALDERVSGMIADYEGASYDLTDPDAVRQAKRDRAYLNGIVKEVDERRRAVKREYMRPYEAFEARANAITAKVKAASAGIKVQLDEAEGKRKAGLYDDLRRYYEDLAGLLAPVVPYESIHEERWLNKTFGEAKARDAIDERVSRVARDWDALKEREGSPRYEVAERAFFETLDLGAALSAQREAREADERIAELREAVEGPAEPGPAPEPEPTTEPEPAPAAPPATATVAAPAPVAPTPVATPVPTAQAPAPAAPAPAAPAAPAGDAPRPWVVIVPSATRQDMERLAQVLGMAEVRGVIRRGTLEEVYAREVANGGRG